ncbi:MAG: Smr/MutS family protein [Planktomarina sp.]
MVRKLKPDERALWNQVADTTIPLTPTRVEVFEPVAPKQVKRAKKLVEASPITPFQIGTKAQAKTTMANYGLSKPTPTMDAKAFGKLTRGQLRPEATMDLHGLTLNEAHPALMDFILGSAQLQRRLVLVITGKGKSKRDVGPIPERKGMLRYHVPQWLRQAPLSGHILEVTQAHQKHGGAGALYIYLRRRR